MEKSQGRIINIIMEIQSYYFEFKLQIYSYTASLEYYKWHKLDKHGLCLANAKTLSSDNNADKFERIYFYNK